MKSSNAIRQILVTVAALVAIGALTFGATACTSATSSVPVVSAQNASAATPAPTPASTSAAAGTSAAAAPAPSGPTAADGKKVVQSSCIGRCHQSGLLDKRYPSARAASIAADMGGKAGLTGSQRAAVVAYFAQ